MNRRLVHILCSFSLAMQMMPACFAAQGQPELNFKIYSPQEGSAPADSGSSSGANGSASGSKSSDSNSSSDKSPVDSLWSTDSTNQNAAKTEGTDASTSGNTTSSEAQPTTTGAESAATDNATPTSDVKTEDGAVKSDKKLLQGYIRVVPSGTKIPIIMDTAVDSDTSQEGDEFAARTGEDLNIDGVTVVPAGSVIKGRLAGLNAPKNLGRSGSVALKFDTVTTPDNRQIPLVANLVARGGVVHARRGVKDIAMDTGTFVLPTVLGVAIGALAGGSSSSSSSSSSSNKLGRGGGALIGAGVGAAVGVIVLCIKKGKKVDVRPGDELKIELAEDLRMPM